MSDLFHSERLGYELSSLLGTLSALRPSWAALAWVAITPQPPLVNLEGARLSWVLFAANILTSPEAGCLVALRLDRHIPFP